jgi:hypothetical protein
MDQRHSGVSHFNDFLTGKYCFGKDMTEQAIHADLNFNGKLAFPYAGKLVGRHRQGDVRPPPRQGLVQPAATWWRGRRLAEGFAFGVAAALAAWVES